MDIQPQLAFRADPAGQALHLPFADLPKEHQVEVKQTIAEQLNRLATTILVNEIDQTPLREPVFLGEVMGEFAEFVGEKKMFEEYLQLMHLSTHTLKVHDFATDILAWVKPIAAWVKSPESESKALAIVNPTGILQVGPTANNLMAQIAAPQALQANVNPMFFPVFNIALDPALEAEMRIRQKIQMISTMLPGGFRMQGWRRREVEQRNGAFVNEKQRALAIAALEANLDRLLKQMEAHDKEMHTSMDDLKHFHNEQVGVLKANQEDLLKEQQKTYDRLVAEEKHAANLQTQIHHLNASLHAAWARINDLANDDGGGICVVQ